MQHCDEVLVKASLIPLIRCCLQNGLSAPSLSDLLGRKSGGAVTFLRHTFCNVATVLFLDVM